MGPKILTIPHNALLDKGPGRVGALAHLVTEEEILFTTIDCEVVGIEVNEDGTAVSLDQRKPLEYISQLAGGPPKPVTLNGRLFVFYMVPLQ